jgi:hypothetical protein
MTFGTPCISLIAVSAFLKLIIYAEIFLLYTLQRNTSDPSVLSNEEFHGKNYEIISNNTIKSWGPFKSILKKNQSNIKDLDI